MKTQLFEHLEATRNRRATRIHKRWQRVRRLGKTRYVILLVAYFWLMMIAGFFFAAWMILPSFEALHRLPPQVYYRLLLLVSIASVIVYFTAAYVWRANERKYTNDRNA